MQHPPLIKTTALSYRYSKDTKTLDNINLHVERGSIYGFLGPNGSGKTTTLSLLLGLLQVQEGHIELFGKTMRQGRTEILGKIGSLVEQPSLYGHLNAMENLEVYRPIYGATPERAAAVLQLVGLAHVRRRSVKKFSLGMKQRLAIALALLPKPELLVLDEPTNGLDPAGIIELRELIRKLNKMEGITVLISSHILAEVEKIASHIGIIHHGRMLFQGPMHALQQLQEKSVRLLIRTSDNDAAVHLLRDLQPEKCGKNILVTIDDLMKVAEINRRLVQQRLDVYLLQPKEQNLEQLFIDLTEQHA